MLTHLHAAEKDVPSEKTFGHLNPKPGSKPERGPAFCSIPRFRRSKARAAGAIAAALALAVPTGMQATTPLTITNALRLAEGMVLAGAGGVAGGTYYVLAQTNLAAPGTNWLVIATNTFNPDGRFVATNPAAADKSIRFFRIFAGNPWWLPPLAPNAFYVSPTGSDANPGTLDRPFLTISKGLTAVGNGGVVYVRGGTYRMSARLSLTKSASPTNTIRLGGYPGETAVIDSTGNTSDGVSISGKGYHLKGLVVMNAGHNGINISGHSNTVEFCTVHDNTNTGLHITGGGSGTTYPSYNLILNCDAYHNYDPPIGGNADGFSAKWNLGPGNVFRGCRAWENSDDGWDLWMGNAPVLIEDCWAFRQGTNYWASPDFNGNGNGFKLGGNYVAAPHRLLRSVAFDNVAHGIDQNNNLAGQTIDQNTAWDNGKRNFNLNHGTNTTPHIVRNNLSIAGASSDSFTSGTLATNNSWQVLSPPAATTDVLSIDASVAIAPRQPDGSLPVWPFLRPVPGGRLVDQGIDIGEPFNGAAPDLGAFETGP